MASTATSIMLIVLMASVSALDRFDKELKHSDSNNTKSFTQSSPINSTFISDVLNATSTTMASVTNTTMKDADMNNTHISTKEQNPTPKPIPEKEMTPQPSIFPPAPKPHVPVQTTTSKASPQDNGMYQTKGPTSKPSSQGSDSVGLIILVVIIILAILAGIICYVARSRGRRYSMDLTSRPDEALMPLSNVEADANGTHNGLQFEGTESNTQEPHEQEEKPEEQMALEAEPEKVVVEVSSPSADSPEHHPQQEVSDPSSTTPVETSPAAPVETSPAAPVETSPAAPVETSPAAPVETSPEEKTDDEGAQSNKTSVESLKENNENNSNNIHLSQRGAGVKMCDTFWDVSLDNMV